MGEVRTNPVTGMEVVVAPERGGRPVDDVSAGGDRSGAHEPSCPFCPGNEDRLPRVLDEVPMAAEPGAQGRDGASWAARASPNRFPAFESDPSAPGPGARPAGGYQEVVVETPRHDEGWEEFGTPHARAALELHRRRWRSVGERFPELRRLLFWNRGPRAGASLSHSHGQLVALEGTPPSVSGIDRRMDEHRQRRGGCIVCDLDGREPSGRRVVLETDHFRVRVPWAAEAPCEAWVVPLRHGPDFGGADDDQLDDLSRLLPRILRAVRNVLGHGQGNLLLHSGPRGSAERAHHWFLRVRPREGQVAGFELLSGLALNPSEPEEDAERLRGALEEEAEAPDRGGADR